MIISSFKSLASIRAKEEYQTHPKRNFQIFATPNVHSSVISSYFFKITFINRKQPPGHHWGSVNKQKKIENLRFEDEDEDDYEYEVFSIVSKARVNQRH